MWTAATLVSSVLVLIMVMMYPTVSEMFYCVALLNAVPAPFAVMQVLGRQCYPITRLHLKWKMSAWKHFWIPLPTVFESWIAQRRHVLQKIEDGTQCQTPHKSGKCHQGQCMRGVLLLTDRSEMILVLCFTMNGVLDSFWGYKALPKTITSSW